MVVGAFLLGLIFGGSFGYVLAALMSTRSDSDEKS